MNASLVPLPHGLRFHPNAHEAWRNGDDSVCVEMIVALLKADATPGQVTPAPLQLDLARAAFAFVDTQVIGFIERAPRGSVMTLFADEARAGATALRIALSAQPVDVAALSEVATLGDRTRAANRGALQRESFVVFSTSTNAVDAVSAVAAIALAPATDLERQVSILRDCVWRAYDRGVPIANLVRALADAIRARCRPELERFDLPWGV